MNCKFCKSPLESTSEIVAKIEGKYANIQTQEYICRGCNTTFSKRLDNGKFLPIKKSERGKSKWFVDFVDKEKALIKGQEEWQKSFNKNPYVKGSISHIIHKIGKGWLW